MNKERAIEWLESAIDVFTTFPVENDEKLRVYQIALEALKEQEDNKVCEYCHPPFKHSGQFYITAGCNNDPYLHIIRKEDCVGGAMIKYCPWCGRELDPLY